jgi:hypothetical protein
MGRPKAGAWEEFVADIFREVDEEVRREQLQKLWDRYGYLAVVAAFLLVAAVAAWRGYAWWDAKKAAESGAAFEAALTLSEAGKHAEAEAAFGKVAAEGTSGYRSLARVRQAAELAQIDPKAAVAAYEQIAIDGGAGQVLQDLATLRAGALLMDAGSFDEARRKLEPIAGAERTFRHTAREFLVLASWRLGDAAGAKRWADIVMTDPRTPSGTRASVERLMALSGSEGKS